MMPSLARRKPKKSVAIAVENEIRSDTTVRNLFEPDAVVELQGRLAGLRPDSTRRWGKMAPAQATAHSSAQMETVLAETFPPRSALGRIFWTPDKIKTPAVCTKRPHSFLGSMTPTEWVTLMYKHLDHHQRQFGV